MMYGSDIQCEPCEFGGTADDVTGAAQHRADHLGVEVRPGHPEAEGLGVPLPSGVDIRGATHPDGRQVVAAAGVAHIGAARQHGAAVEIEHQSAGLVDSGHPQRGKAGRGATRLGAVLLQAHHLGAGGQGVADHREPVEHQSAVKQIGLDPLSHHRGLADRDIAHQPRVGHVPGPAESGAGQLGVHRQPQPVADDRLMGGRDTASDRHRRRRVEDLPDTQIIEIGPARFNVDRAVHRHTSCDRGVLVNQALLVELAGIGARELLLERDRPRALVMRQPIP